MWFRMSSLMFSTQLVPTALSRGRFPPPARTMTTNAAHQQPGGHAQNAHRRLRALITGGNGGMGYEAALGLLKKGYEVTLACSNDAKSQDAAARLREAVPGAPVNIVHLDLADLSSVKKCAAQLSQQEPFDVLINNAGVACRSWQPSKDGYEMHFAVNYLGHFALTSLLLPKLLQAGRPVRIVNVASAGHMMSRIKFDDLMRTKLYNTWEVYGQSKLAMIIWTMELAKKLEGTNVSVHALHPGVVNTHLGRTYGSALLGSLLPRIIAPLLWMTPRQAGDVIVHVATSPEVTGSGRYWSDWKTPRKPSTFAYDPETNKRLMEVSEQMTGVPLVPPDVTAAPPAARAAA